MLYRGVLIERNEQGYYCATLKNAGTYIQCKELEDCIKAIYYDLQPDITRKQVAAAYTTIFRTGCGELCPLDEIFVRIGENAGWEAYEVSPDIAVVTGSRGLFGNPLPDVVKNILKNARRYRKNHRGEQERRYLTRAARRFASVLASENAQ